MFLSLRGTTEQYNEKEKVNIFKKLKLYEGYGDLRGVCSMNNNIALLYRDNGMNEEALKIFRENVIHQSIKKQRLLKYHIKI